MIMRRQLIALAFAVISLPAVASERCPPDTVACINPFHLAALILLPTVVASFLVYPMMRNITQRWQLHAIIAIILGLIIVILLSLAYLVMQAECSEYCWLSIR